MQRRMKITIIRRIFGTLKKFTNPLTFGRAAHIIFHVSGKPPHEMAYILGCALVSAFTHRFIKGFRVGMQMSGLHYAEEDSKQSQVSALPERRVKK